MVQSFMHDGQTERAGEGLGKGCCSRSHAKGAAHIINYPVRAWFSAVVDRWRRRFLRHPLLLPAIFVPHSQLGCDDTSLWLGTIEASVTNLLITRLNDV